MVVSIVKIPVLPMTKKWILVKFPNQKVDKDTVDFSKIDSRDLQLGFFKRFLMSSLERFASNKTDFQGEYLKIKLPSYYSKYGLSEEKMIQIGLFLDQICRNDLVMHVGLLACFPEFSRASSIRIVLSFYGITDEEYDPSSFRRYFDRYSNQSLGEEFLVYRTRFNAFLKNYIDNKFGKELRSI
ncbi:MAG: hypothetical protein KGZ90_05110 [Algoriphagus sp.]|nr:hypothetical protein [Algoriphagus sp.]